MNGVIYTIKRRLEESGVVLNRGGYFFIRTPDGVERFAHASNLVPPASFPSDKLGPRPTDIREGQDVEFEPIEIVGKGLRADRVRAL